MEVNPTSGVVAVPRYPTVGRIVHYVDWATGQHRAAMITAVLLGRCDARVSLAVVHPTGIMFLHDVGLDEGQTPGTWHWPERD